MPPGLVKLKALLLAFVLLNGGGGMPLLDAVLYHHQAANPAAAVRAEAGDAQGPPFWWQTDVAVAEGWRIRWWDFLFYFSFGLVITFSVPVAGVLLVFSFLVIPAAIAFQFTRQQGMLAAISWFGGVLASAGGLWISFRYDLPTGPLVVCSFGVLLLGAYLVRRAFGIRVEEGLAPISKRG